MYHPFNWLKKHEHTYLTVLAILIGILSGYGAVILRTLIRVFQGLFYGNGGDFVIIYSNLPLWKIIFIPAGSALGVGLLIYFFAREAQGHGVPEVMKSITLYGGKIPKRVSIIKTIASALTMGGGGSVGPEGPIAQIGAGFGSTLGKWLMVSDDKIRTLVGAGVAGGISAVFNAPIAGSLFAAEIILGDLSLITFSPVIVSSVFATVVSRYYMGNSPAFLVPAYKLVSGCEYIFYVILGLLSGAVSILFIECLYKVEDFFDSLRVKGYIKPMIGGLLLGIIIIKFPQVFGEGYSTITRILNENTLWYVLFTLVLVKILATSISLGSGASGGVFAPALFIGAALGGGLGALLHQYFPYITASQGAYALVGMGAVVSGSMFCPITAVIMIFEITNEYTIILPLMIASAISTFFVHRFKEGSIYTLKLLRQGVNLYRGREIQILKELSVNEILSPAAHTIKSYTPLSEISELFKKTGRTTYPVIDDDGNIEGVVALHFIRRYMFDYETKDIIIAGDIQIPYSVPIYISDDLLSAMEKFNIIGTEEWPVVSPIQPEKILGVIQKINVFNRYNNEVFIHRTSTDNKKRFKNKD